MSTANQPETQERTNENHQPCERCGDRSGHGPAADAYCAFRRACADDIKDRAERLGADPLAAVDLLAHLCSVWSVPDAHKAAAYVLNLGWRPGALIPAANHEQARGVEAVHTLW